MAAVRGVLVKEEPESDEPDDYVAAAATITGKRKREDEGNDDNVSQITKISAKKAVNGTTMYLTHWGDGDPTWVRREDILSAQIVADFERSQLMRPPQKKPTTKKSYKKSTAFKKNQTSSSKKTAAKVATNKKAGKKSNARTTTKAKKSATFKGLGATQMRKAAGFAPRVGTAGEYEAARHVAYAVCNGWPSARVAALQRENNADINLLFVVDDDGSDVIVPYRGCVLHQWADYRNAFDENGDPMDDDPDATAGFPTGAAFREKPREEILEVMAADASRLCKLFKSLYAAFDTQDSIGQTALMLAAGSGNIYVADELLRAGASMNIVDQEGYDALQHALIGGNHKTARLLIERGAPLNREDRGDSFLHFIVRHVDFDTQAETVRTLELVKRLLDQYDREATEGKDVRPHSWLAQIVQYNDKGLTPVQEAAKQGVYHCLKHFIDAGAPNTLTFAPELRKQQSCLQLARRWDALLQAALQAATQEEYLKTIKLMIKEGISVHEDWTREDCLVWEEDARNCVVVLEDWERAVVLDSDEMIRRHNEAVKGKYRPAVYAHQQLLEPGFVDTLHTRLYREPTPGSTALERVTRIDGGHVAEAMAQQILAIHTRGEGSEPPFAEGLNICGIVINDPFNPTRRLGPPGVDVLGTAIFNDSDDALVLAKGTVLGEYVGLVRCLESMEEEETRENRHAARPYAALCASHDDKGWAQHLTSNDHDMNVDGETHMNEFALLNDYHENPYDTASNRHRDGYPMNCTLHREYLVDGWPHVFVVLTANATIEPGDVLELLVDYGPNYWMMHLGQFYEEREVALRKDLEQRTRRLRAAEKMVETRTSRIAEMTREMKTKDRRILQLERDCAKKKK